MTSVASRAAECAVLSLALMAGAASIASGYEPPDVYVARLVDTWQAQPPADRDNTGFALSVAFLNWPSLFLREMHAHPEAFKPWLETLAQHTLRHEGEPGRGRWVVRQMASLAARWDGVRYRDMTESIREAAGACAARVKQRR